MYAVLHQLSSVQEVDGILRGTRTLYFLWGLAKSVDSGFKVVDKMRVLILLGTLLFMVGIFWFFRGRDRWD